MRKRICIVDCGSGSSRASVYSVHEDGFVHEDRYISSGIIPTLAQSLSKGEHLEWVSKLKEVLVEDSATITGVIIGATGGLRKALREGIVSAPQLSRFRQVLKANVPDALLVQLSGEEEAKFELMAVRYLAQYALPGNVPRLTGGRKGIGRVGVLSSGGSSSQVCYTDGDSGEDRYMSLDTNLIGAIAKARENGGNLRFYENYMWKLILDNAPRKKINGTFLVIELAGSIGKEAGLADRLVPKREAVQLITQHFQTLSLVRGKDNKVRLAEETSGGGKAGRTPSSISWFSEARQPVTILVNNLLQMFSGSCLFYFSTSFEIGSKHNVLRVQWPLGMFLASLQGEGQQALCKL